MSLATLQGLEGDVAMKDISIGTKPSPVPGISAVGQQDQQRRVGKCARHTTSNVQ